MLFAINLQPSVHVCFVHINFVLSWNEIAVPVNILSEFQSCLLQCPASPLFDLARVISLKKKMRVCISFQ